MLARAFDQIQSGQTRHAHIRYHGVKGIGSSKGLQGFFGRGSLYHQHSFGFQGHGQNGSHAWFVVYDKNS
jgi:hypothetical protein